MSVLYERRRSDSDIEVGIPDWLALLLIITLGASVLVKYVRDWGWWVLEKQ